MPGTTGVVIGLKDSTLEHLDELRRLNIDSAKGLEECMELLNDPQLIAAFRDIAHDRRENAHMLGTQIEWNSDSEPSGGSLLASLHRTWIKMRELCSQDSVEAILAETQRGESTIRQAYEKAISETAGSPINEELVLQLNGLRRVEDRLKSLPKD